MGRLTLILGGVRSGKSDCAVQLAREAGGPVLFVATAAAADDEMRRRIRHHRASRPAGWQTLEVQVKVGATLLAGLEQSRAEIIIVDCITLLVSNVLLSLPEDSPFDVVMQNVKAEIDSLLSAQSKLGGEWILVSNEVGLGVIPPYPLGRSYCDALGRANQMLARAADKVLFMMAGIPMTIK